MKTASEVTEKQRRAMEALQSARGEGMTLSDYAKAHGLAIWELYNALACLRRKGVLPKSPASRTASSWRCALCRNGLRRYRSERWLAG
jgi:hypothetical protein